MEKELLCIDAADGSGFVCDEWMALLLTNVGGNRVVANPTAFAVEGLVLVTVEEIVCEGQKNRDTRPIGLTSLSYSNIRRKNPLCKGWWGCQSLNNFFRFSEHREK